MEVKTVDGQKCHPYPNNQKDNNVERKHPGKPSKLLASNNKDKVAVEPKAIVEKTPGILHIDHLNAKFAVFAKPLL